MINLENNQYNIKHIRVDERLVHGQVATQWTKVKQVEQIIVISDKAANDPIQKQLIGLAAPPQVKVKLFGAEQFLTIVSKHEIKKSTMLVFGNILDVLKVYESGFPIKSVNAGGMSARSDRRQASHSVFVNEEENAAFLTLMDKGVEIVVQTVPKAAVENYKNPFAN